MVTRRWLGACRIGLGISVFAATGASAQNAPHNQPDFSMLATGRTLIVVDSNGHETRGRIMSLTPEELKLAVGGRTVSLVPSQVARAFVPGDSVRNGTMIGLVTGATLGFLGGTQNSCGDFWTGIRPCQFNEKVLNGIVSGALTGAITAAIGAGIDALIPGRRLIYRRPEPASKGAVFIAAAAEPSRIRLVTSVSW